MTFGVVTVDEVLKGTPQAKMPGTILVARLAQRGLSEADLPAGEVVLFLNNYAQQRVESGAAPSKDPDDRYYYSRPNSYQGVLRNFDGVVEVVDVPRRWEEFVGPLASRLDGKPFGEIVDRIRAFTAGSQ